MKLNELLKNHVIIIADNKSKEVIKKHVYVYSSADDNSSSEIEYRKIIKKLILESNEDELLIIKLGNELYAELISLSYNKYLEYIYFNEVLEEMSFYVDDIVNKIKNL